METNKNGSSFGSFQNGINVSVRKLCVWTQIRRGSLTPSGNKKMSRDEELTFSLSRVRVSQRKWGGGGSEREGVDRGSG